VRIKELKSGKQAKLSRLHPFSFTKNEGASFPSNLYLPRIFVGYNHYLENIPVASKETGKRNCGAS
jgi:hypothetical protein